MHHYIRDQARNREVRLHFANGAPKEFKTGKKFRIHGRKRTDAAIDVDGLTAMADGTVSDSGTADSVAEAATDSRKVLTILVDFNDALVDNGSSNGISLQEAKDRMFNETRNVRHFYQAASLGSLDIIDDLEANGEQEVFGPYKINFDYMNSTCAYYDWVGAARAAWEADHPGRSYTEYRHTLLIVPNYWDYTGDMGRSCTWGGIANVGCGTTCMAIVADPKSILHGVIIHELGHNFTMHHASTDPDNNGSINSEYGDYSDNMGGSRIWARFNSVHAAEMGWHDAADYEIRTIVPASGSLHEYDLIAIDADLPDAAGLRAVRMPRDANSDYYLSYRLNTGHYNGVNTAYSGKLNIHYGTGSNRSYFVTTLAPGETYNDPHNGLVITAVEELQVDALKVMSVQVCKDSCASIPAPGDLAAGANGSSAIDVSWTYDAGLIDSFTLQHSLDNSSWNDLYLGSDLAYAHTGLATASTHYYRVQAHYGEETSGWSSVASATTDVIPPVAAFEWTAEYTEVRFTDLSTDETGIVNWYWNFGDGNSSSQASPVHTYAQAGDYAVTLTVTDEHGATDRADDLVSVEAPPWTDHVAQSQSTAAGTVSGALSATYADDGAAEAITERESGGKPSKRYTWLEHQWDFNIPWGAQATVIANAWQLDTGEGDHFDFEYSINGGPWTFMFQVDSENEDTQHRFMIGNGVSGNVSVRVIDTDETPGNRAKDTVFVDHLMIRVENGGGDPPNGRPTGLAAEAEGHDTIHLAWTDNSSNESGFRIERWNGSGWSEAGTVDADVAAFSDTGLDALTTYTYRVIAFNFMGESSPSTEAQATTGEAPPPPPVTFTLNVEAVKTRAVQTPFLTWTPNEAMDVWYKQSSPVMLAEGVMSGFTHDTGAKKGTSYDYQVCFTGTETCSDWVTVNY